MLDSATGGGGPIESNAWPENRIFNADAMVQNAAT